ncbi:ATP-grasp domain-containing protein [Schleiferiaceae bacterium]|nr:ATP-grasp domain-containing protein [Schleiferiaceae bacterium]
MRTRVAVVMGGYSSEYGISVKSGEAVFRALNRSLFEAYVLTLSKEGWTAQDEHGEPVGFDPSQMHILHQGSSQKIDLIFNLIHGHPGEDGTLAITWEALGIPYTSCSPAASALTFHKAWTNGVITRLGVPVAPAIWTSAGVPAESLFPALELMEYPLFVKPCRSGSSYGVSRITSPEELGAALEAAAVEDQAIVIEQGVLGIEVGCGVVRLNNRVETLGITEIVPKKAFFDFAAKYEGLSEEITPARISKESARHIELLTKRVYEGLGLAGFCRADFILPAEGLPVLIEINTVPGMSAESILPKQLGARGTSLTEFTTLVAQQALSDASNRTFPGIF